jgi:hypothetical protein
MMKVGVVIDGKEDRRRGMRDGKEVEEAEDMEVSGLIVRSDTAQLN